MENKKINERELVVPFKTHTCKLVEECRKKEFDENREKGVAPEVRVLAFRPAGPLVRQSRSVNLQIFKLHISTEKQNHLSLLKTFYKLYLLE